MRRGGKATKGPAPMEVDEVKGPPSNPEEEIRETQTTEARSTESTVRNDGETQNEALAEQARPVSKAGKSRAKGREVMCGRFRMSYVSFLW